jgi:hypothetical protein
MPGKVRYEGHRVSTHSWVSSIRASSIGAIAIMTNAVETNRVLGSPLSWCVTHPFPPNCIRASPPNLYSEREIRHHAAFVARGDIDGRPTRARQHFSRIRLLDSTLCHCGSLTSLMQCSPNASAAIAASARRSFFLGRNGRTIERCQLDQLDAAVLSSSEHSCTSTSVAPVQRSGSMARRNATSWNLSRASQSF